MIFTGFHYNNSLFQNDTLIKRPYPRPDKTFESFEIWYNYIKANYPNEHIYILTANSPIPIEKVYHLFNNCEIINDDTFTFNKDKQIHIKKISKDRGYPLGTFYFHYQALKTAYLNNIDLFWIDSDCFINKNFLYLTQTSPIFCFDTDYNNMSSDVYFYFMANYKLHEMDKFYNLVECLDRIWKNESDTSLIEAYMGEGGFFNNFVWGEIGSAGKRGNEFTHWSSHKDLIDFLEKNPQNNNFFNKFLQKLKEQNANL